MIFYPRNLALRDGQAPAVRLIGVGNAGCHIADHAARSFPGLLEFVAIDSDRSSKPSSPAIQCLDLGPLTTHGIGAGGDPELALEAARESRGDLQKCLTGADVLILCGGLGGGTASATLPFLAELARSPEVMVTAIVTTPFSFEGRRRALQAGEALKSLEKHADAVVHFENDRMADLQKPLNHVRETFGECDRILLQAVGAIANLARGGAPLPVSRNDLLTVLRSSSGGFVFGAHRAEGGDRAVHAVAGALASPLLDQGRLLREAAKILVHISGPENLRFDEVATVMQAVSAKAADSSLLHISVNVSPDHEFAVTLIGRCGATAQPAQAPATPVAKPETTTDFTLVAEPSKPAAKKAKQEDLPLDPVSKGPFVGSQPTLVGKEDLDIPTFVRIKARK
jgi:cell division protein FtsZ